MNQLAIRLMTAKEVIEYLQKILRTESFTIDEMKAIQNVVRILKYREVRDEKTILRDSNKKEGRNNP